MRTYNVTGLVLHGTALGETDKILTLFTRELGKIAAVAKGARKPGGKLTGSSELFISARFQLARGRTLEVVSQCEIVDSFPRIRRDLDKLTRATYICELLDRLTHDHDAASSELLHDITVAALRLLQRAGGFPDSVVHAYELHILAEAGYSPTLEQCVKCGRAAAASSTAFSPSQGGLLCPDHRHTAPDVMVLTEEALAALICLRDSEPEQLLIFEASTRLAAELAQVLNAYIANRLDRPLKSAAFLDQIRRSEKSLSVGS